LGSNAAYAVLLVICALGPFSLWGCAPNPLTVSRQVVFCDWAEDKVQEVLDAFQLEYGVSVLFEPYASQEQLIEELKTGKRCDVIVMDNQLVPQLIEQRLLAELDLQHILNYTYLSHNFVDKSFDPGNRYSLPYTWGTFGLIVKTDPGRGEVAKWADLWNPDYRGQLVLWTATPRYTVGAALIALGYSVNSEDPAELEAAVDRLIELKPHALWLEDDPSIAPYMKDEAIWIGAGWAYDYWLADEEDATVSYVLPQEGAILWGDSLMIAANTPNLKDSEKFIDFLLRPEVAAKISNQTYYASTNEEAVRYVDTEILLDPAVYPLPDDLKKAQLLLPLSPQGQELFDRMWQRFQDAP